MSVQSQTDEELGLQVARRAPDASAHALFDELYRRLAVIVERFIAARIAAVHVGDIHQKTWLKAWHRAQQFTSGHTYRAWLFTIARNTITDHFRATARRPVQALPDQGEHEPSAVDDPQTDLEANDERRALTDCLSELEQLAADLVRGRLGGRNYQELCQTLELKEAAAHKLFFQSKNRLQECVQRKLA